MGFICGIPTVISLLFKSCYFQAHCLEKMSNLLFPFFAAYVIRLWEIGRRLVIVVNNDDDDKHLEKSPSPTSRSVSQLLSCPKCKCHKMACSMV